MPYIRGEHARRLKSEKSVKKIKATVDLTVAFLIGSFFAGIMVSVAQVTRVAAQPAAARQALSSTAW
jgi:hypothetical protein